MSTGAMTNEVSKLQKELDAERVARQHAEESLRALADGGELIARHSTSERVLQELVEQIRITTKADIVILYPYLEVTRVFQFPRYVSGALLDREFPEQHYSRPDDIASLTLNRGKPLFATTSETLFKDLGGDFDQRKGEFEVREKIKSTAAMALSVGDEPVGVLFVNFRAPQPFDDPQKHLIQGLAHHAATAIQNARNYGRAERELRRFSRLYDASWALGHIIDSAELDKAYDIILRRADVTQDSQAFICRFEEEQQELVIVHSLGLRDAVKSKRIGLDQGINAQVARERRPIVVHDTSNPPEGIVGNTISESAVNSIVVIPIDFGSRYYGNLTLSHEKANYYRDADVELMQGLAKQLAITIYRLETADARREAEQRATEAEAMSSVGQATFELSHRLGNDLGLVESFVNNVRETLISQGFAISLVEDDLNHIVEDVGSVLGLSRGLRQAFADLRNREIQNKIVIPARELLQEVAHSYPGLPANVQVRFDIASDVQPVNAVLSQVMSALRNLFVNAVEALPDGGTIVLGARNAGKYVKIEVTDDGHGVELKRQKRVFDLFYSTKGGAGFGLWSARRYALVNGGDLTMASKPGEGATLTLLLPKANTSTS